MLATMHDRLLRWSRLRLGYRGRVLVVKTMVTSLAWFAACMWELPNDVHKRLRSMCKYYF